MGRYGLHRVGPAGVIPLNVQIPYDREGKRGGRAEEGSAAFCSFHNSFWSWYLLGGEFDFLAALFIYTCFDHSRAEQLSSHSYYSSKGWLRLHFLFFPPGLRRGRETRGEKMERGRGRGSTSEQAAGLGL